MRVRINLRRKLFITVIGVVFVLNTIVMSVIGIRISNQSKQTALEISRSKSKEVAVEVENYLNQAIETGINLSNTFVSLKANSPSRTDVQNILNQTLKTNSNYKAVWTMWEKDQFDGKDDDYLDDPVYYQTSGRLNLTFYKNGTAIIPEPGADEQYQEDYYTLPRQSREIFVIDPYNYSYTGDSKDEIYETTVSIPIYDRDEFLGVIGIDIELSNLIGLIGDSKLYKTGFAAVISHELQIAAHPDSMLVKKKINEIIGDQLVVDNLGSGVGFELIGDGLFRCFYPIQLKGFSKNWSVMVEIPLSEVNAGANRLVWVMSLLNLLFLTLLTVVVYVVAKNLSTPIIRGAELAKKIADGKLISNLAYSNRNDEVGELTNALISMSEKLSKVVAGIKEEANTITKASVHLSSTAEQFSQGATEQASTVEEVSSTM